MRCNVCLVLYGLLACIVCHMHVAAAVGVPPRATRRAAAKAHRGRRKAATDGGDGTEPATPAVKTTHSRHKPAPEDDDSKLATLTVKKTTHASHKAAPGAHADEPATHTDADDAELVAKARRTTHSSHRVVLEDDDSEPVVHTVKKAHSGHRAAPEDDGVKPVVHHHKSKGAPVHQRQVGEDDEPMGEGGEDIMPKKKPHQAQAVGKAKLPAPVALKEKMQPGPSRRANDAMKAASYYKKMQAMEDKWNSKRKERAQAKNQQQMQKGMGDFLAKLGLPR